MKSLLLIPILLAPLLLTSCETVVVDRHPHRGAYVERDVVADRYPRHNRYDDRDVVVDRYPRRGAYVERNVVVATPRARRDVVVVNPRTDYRARTEVRYYSDSRGRYYFKNGRRIYTNAGVHY